jgi:hypothetical protein
MLIYPSTPEIYYLSRPNDSLLSKWKSSLQKSLTSLAIFLLSTMLDSQAFSIISPLVYSEIDNLEFIATPSFVDDTNASWKVVREKIASLSLKQMLFNALSIT